MNYNFEDALKWLQDILKINTVESTAKENYPFGEGVGKCLEYSLNLLKSLGFRTKNLEGYCGWGEIGEGELFGILNHLDVVPEGSNWTYPPYGAEIHNGKLYGRGTLDDKGPFIACLFATAKLLQEGFIPRKRIRFILGCDEESGWKCMERYFKTEEIPKLGISPDGDFPVINCEKGIVYHSLKFSVPEGIFELFGGNRANMVPDKATCRVRFSDKIENRAKEKSLKISKNGDTFTLEAFGKSAHGSHPELGENAIMKIYYALGAEYPVFEKMYNAFNDFSGKSIGLDLSDEKSGKLTLNLGTAKIADKTIVNELDIRYPISYNKNDITRILKENLPIEISQEFFHDPLYVDENHPMIKSLLKAYDEALGNKEKSQPISIGGGTYARCLPVGVAFGPILPGMDSPMHQKDEYISIENLKKLVKIYYKAIKEICFYG